MWYVKSREGKVLLTCNLMQHDCRPAGLVRMNPQRQVRLLLEHIRHCVLVEIAPSGLNILYRKRNAAEALAKGLGMLGTRSGFGGQPGWDGGIRRGQRPGFRQVKTLRA